MKVWTVHARPGAAPLLVRDGFSWGALLFGPLWLSWHRAWIPAALTIAFGLVLALLSGAWGGLLLGALSIALGLFGHDLWRWSLDQRGYLLTEIVAAPDEDAALGRLLDRRPDYARAAWADALR